MPAYNRLDGKTQVFSFRANDDLTRRGLHVQLVARVARDIGRALGLNLDLIEATALGHDIGHTPFGHAGERFLNDVYHERTNRWFFHNVQSVRVLDVLGGRNLSLQTLDGVICHNGEFEQQVFETSLLSTFDEFDRGVESCWEGGDAAIRHLRPMARQLSTNLLDNVTATMGNLFNFFLGLVLAYWLAMDYPIIVRELCTIAGPKHSDEMTLMSPHPALGSAHISDRTAATTRHVTVKSSARQDRGGIRARAVTIIVGVVVIAALVFVGVRFVLPLVSGGTTDDSRSIVAGQSVEVTIPAGSSAGQIAQSLYDAGVISSTSDFLAQVQRRDISASLKSGTYTFITGGDMHRRRPTPPSSTSAASSSPVSPSSRYAPSSRTTWLSLRTPRSSTPPGRRRCTDSPFMGTS